MKRIHHDADVIPCENCNTKSIMIYIVILATMWPSFIVRCDRISRDVRRWTAAVEPGGVKSH